MAAAFSASMFSARARRAKRCRPCRGCGRRCGGDGILPARPFFADTDQLDRLAGDGAHRKGCAAAAVAVHAGQHEAGDADAFVEAAGEIDGVLTGQAIGDQQDFMRVRLLLDVGHLDHQGLVDMRAAGGVEDDDVMAAELGSLHGAGGDIGRRLA
jgi:hypothetical protein